LAFTLESRHSTRVDAFIFKVRNEVKKMATASKKYYWLKLKDDFFRDKRIKKLRRIAGGDTYTVIYLKLQLLSLKNNGVLIYEGVEDTFEEELALDIDEDVDNVKITVSFLEANGLIDEEAPNQFTMTETIKCIGSESDSAARVRKHRELKAQQQLALQCNGAVTTSNIEIDIRDKKQDLETKDKMQEESTELAALPANAGDNGQQIVSFEEQAFNEFWKLYPKKVNKKGAFTSFKRIKHLKTELPLILAAVEKFKASKDWQKDNGQFIPHPQTFINQERWKDQQELTREQQLNTIDMQGWV
jgi:predicted phage replisome organizer